MKAKRKRRMSRRRRERTYIAVMVLLAIAASIGLTRSVMRDDKEFEEHEQQSQEFNARMQRIDEKREACEYYDMCKQEIPANGYLMQTDMKLLLKQEANQVTRLRDALEEISEAYDYCICDCGRLLDMVVINILLAAELVIAPVKVGGYENEAIHNLQEQVDDLREINPELRIKGLVTMRQKNKTSLDFEEWMKTSSGFDMFVTPIRRSIVAEKASMRMAVLPQFSKNCIVSQDYRNVVHELLKELEG